MKRREISTYASGDGALSFRATYGNMIPAGNVSFAQAKRYLNTKKGKREGWRLVKLNNIPYLVACISRIDANTLLVDGEVYQYSIDESYCNGNKNTNYYYTESSLKTTFECDGVVFDMPNWSIRASIVHFLNNEELLNVPPNQLSSSTQTV